MSLCCVQFKDGEYLLKKRKNTGNCNDLLNILTCFPYFLTHVGPPIPSFYVGSSCLVDNICCVILKCVLWFLETKFLLADLICLLDQCFYVTVFQILMGVN